MTWWQWLLLGLAAWLVLALAAAGVIGHGIREADRRDAAEGVQR